MIPPTPHTPLIFPILLALPHLTLLDSSQPISVSLVPPRQIFGLPQPLGAFGFPAVGPGVSDKVDPALGLRGSATPGVLGPT